MTKRAFDAVFIDFYGTIAAGDRAAVEFACQRIVAAFALPLTPCQLAVRWGEIFFATIEHANHDGFRTLHECERVSLVETLRPFVGESAPEPYVAPLEAYWRDPPLHDDALPMLSALDLPVCCVSNADTPALAAALERHALRFDALVTSQDVRAYKPEPAIFLRAIEALGVDPTRVLHVGDSLHSDVGGANRLGITSVWIHRDERIHDIGAHPPVHTIRTLADLPKLLLDDRRVTTLSA
jgi:2-haloacid dehalogenase/putative hydrolase of the HAD superfamily